MSSNNYNVGLKLRPHQTLRRAELRRAALPCKFSKRGPTKRSATRENPVFLGDADYAWGEGGQTW